jgi:hypothetical protein
MGPNFKYIHLHVYPHVQPQPLTYSDKSRTYTLTTVPRSFTAIAREQAVESRIQVQKIHWLCITFHKINKSGKIKEDVGMKTTYLLNPHTIVITCFHAAVGWTQGNHYSWVRCSMSENH